MTTRRPHVAVVLAGGVGSRLGADVPKQFLMIGGKMVIEHAVDAFEQNDHIDEIAIVSNPAYMDEIADIVKRNGWRKVAKILAGGKERYDSTLAALRAYADREVFLVLHDAARPLVSQRIIDDVCERLLDYDVVDVLTPVVDTIARIEGEDAISVPDRAKLRSVQTPQGFDNGVLGRAYEKALADPDFKATDDCSVVVKYLQDTPVGIVEGEARNMKLTHKEDIMILERFLNPPAPQKTAEPLPEGVLDVSVLLLFFNRPEPFGQVFEAVRAVRPARLFLYQDGPRGERDMPGIEACRQIAARVDWPCEVKRLYQDKNYGCDPSEYISQKWAFTHTEKCIVLEDDDVAVPSFFTFCKEMLDRYADDERVGMIAGFNPDERTDDVGDDSYFFTTNFSIWGWASWRRVIDTWDADYAFLDRPEAVERIEALTRERRLRADFLPMCRAHRASGKAYYETIFHAALLLNSQLAIVPRVNMVNNIGISADSTHFAGSVATLPRGYRRIFTMGRHDIDFPLQHPHDMVDHVDFRRRVYRIMAWGHPWIKFCRSLEELCINVRHGQWSRIFSAFTNRLGIFFRGQKFH